MSAEPPGCVSSGCNTACPAGTTATYSTQCSAGATGTQSRCCPGDSYPEVLLLVDRGTGQPTSFLVDNVTHADYSYLRNEWTSAKELLALPGEHCTLWAAVYCCSTCSSSCICICMQPAQPAAFARKARAHPQVPATISRVSIQASSTHSTRTAFFKHTCMCVWVHASGGQWQQLKDYGELDMANPATLAGFLQRGLTRCAQCCMPLGGAAASHPQQAAHEQDAAAMCSGGPAGQACSQR